MSDHSPTANNLAKQIAEVVLTAQNTAQNSESDRFVSVIVRFLESRSIAFLTHEGKHNKVFLPTGKVEIGETLVAAAKRELEEETGLTVEEKDLYHCHTVQHRLDDGQIVPIYCYLVDLNISVLFEGKYRNKEDARHIALKSHNASGETPANPDNFPVWTPCHVVRANNNQRRLLVPCYYRRALKHNGVSFGIPISLKCLDDAFRFDTEPDNTAGFVDGYTLRFKKEESALWDVLLRR